MLPRMKRSELYLNLLSVPADAAALIAAGVTSFYLRQQPGIIARPIRYELTLSQFLNVAALVVPVVLVLFALFGLYNLRGVRRAWDEFRRVTGAVSLGLLAVVILFFFDRQVFPSRFILLGTWGVGIIFVLSVRWLLRLIQRAWLARGVGIHRIAIVGAFPGHAAPVEALIRAPSYGYQVVAELPFERGATAARVGELHDRGLLDEILVASPDLSGEDSLELAQLARSRGLAFSFVPNLFEAQRTRVEVSSLAGVPLIQLKNTPLDGWGQVVKRVFDVAASSVCIAICSPLYLGVYLAIRLESRGPAIYAAARGGRGRDFTFYKFRSMYTHLSVGEGYGGAEAEQIRQQLWEKNDRGGKDAPFLKVRDDPRVTRVGRFIRRTKLDEIPQFWNVLRGDMSMVGPRAHVIEEVERYRTRYRRMFSIKPGIFGMSQIAQMSWPDLPFEEEIRLNTFYIESWSFWLDVEVLAKSAYLLLFAPKLKEDY